MLHRNTTRIVITITLALVLTGCGSKQSTVLGKIPAQEASATVRELPKKAGTAVTLQGEMIEKCPVAGCWFMLRDKTGVVRVDTKAAGFVVSEVALHTKMIVTGTVTTGPDSAIKATGLRY